MHKVTIIEHVSHHELRALSGMATEGPWHVDGALCPYHSTETVAIYHRKLWPGLEVKEVLETGCRCGDQAISQQDADFIVAAVNFVRHYLAANPQLGQEVNTEQFAISRD